MILCLGTTPTVQRTMVFSKFTLDIVNRAREVTEYASGKSANVARILHGLGLEVLELGFLGGRRGEFFREDFSRAGIPHDFVTVPAQTRLCTTIIDEPSGVVTELVEESPALPPEAYEALFAKYAAALKEAQIIVLSGSLPPGAPQDFYARCVRSAGPQRPVILDAVGQPLLEALPQRPTVVKPNVSEMARTLGMPIDTDDAIREGMKRLVQLGAGWVIVTRGKADTLISDGKNFWRIDTPSVKVISPIGSGDAFAAGLTAGLVREQNVPEACRLAVACGAANAMTPHSGHLNVVDVQPILDRVKLETL
jgi:1-phosphofructokinase family hexose kinase